MLFQIDTFWSGPTLFVCCCLGRMLLGQIQWLPVIRLAACRVYLGGKGCDTRKSCCRLQLLQMEVDFEMELPSQCQSCSAIHHTGRSGSKLVWRQRWWIMIDWVEWLKSVGLLFFIGSFFFSVSGALIHLWGKGNEYKKRSINYERNLSVKMFLNFHKEGWEDHVPTFYTHHHILNFEKN